MTWLEIDDGHPYGMATFPYGVCSIGGVASVVVRIGDGALDLAAVSDLVAIRWPRSSPARR